MKHHGWINSIQSEATGQQMLTMKATYLVILDELPVDDVINEILMTHETVTYTFQQPRQINSSPLGFSLDPRLDGVKHDLLVFNIELVVAQYCLQLVVMEILEFRALQQYLLEVVTYVFAALLLEIAAEVMACKFENTCDHVEYFFQRKHDEFVNVKSRKSTCNFAQTNNFNAEK